MVTTTCKACGHETSYLEFAPFCYCDHCHQTVRMYPELACVGAELSAVSPYQHLYNSSDSDNCRCGSTRQVRWNLSGTIGSCLTCGKSIR